MQHSSFQVTYPRLRPYPLAKSTFYVMTLRPLLTGSCITSRNLFNNFSQHFSTTSVCSMFLLVVKSPSIVALFDYVRFLSQESSLRPISRIHVRKIMRTIHAHRSCKVWQCIAAVISSLLMHPSAIDRTDQLSCLPSFYPLTVVSHRTLINLIDRLLKDLIHIIHTPALSSHPTLPQSHSTPIAIQRTFVYNEQFCPCMSIFHYHCRIPMSAIPCFSISSQSNSSFMYLCLSSSLVVFVEIESCFGTHCCTAV